MIRYAILTLTVLIVLAVAALAGIAQTRLTETPTRSIWSGVYTEPQARRGEELYSQRCGRCHGADLMGMPLEPQQRFPAGPDRTPPLVGPIFLSNYDDVPLCDLVERIRISMPQDTPGSLTRKDVVDVVAFLLFQGGFPFGRTDLTTRFDDLQEIRILAHRSSGPTSVGQRSCSY